MAFFTCFDDLPDLVLIELFSYLSSIDILWGFTCLNHRFKMLITERGFFYHINLSLARYHQFNRILHFLPLNNIQSLAIDCDASPRQLNCWPYLPCLRTFLIIGLYNHDDLLRFLLLHAATLTHLIIQSSERIVPDGYSAKFEYPLGDMVTLIDNIILFHLPALRSLDLGMDYYGTCWSITTAIVPLTYLRLALPCMDTLVLLMSTQPLPNTLRQLHIKLSSGCSISRSSTSTSNPLIRMVNLHTFTVIQTFFSKFTIEWTIFENLTSSNVMPILQHANISLFININDLNRISSSSLFTDHRHVDVHFTFNLINCPQYIKVTQYIPRGNRFHPREIIGVTFVVNHWSSRSEWFTDKDPFSSDRQYYHHMWYTLPWTFDEFFHEYIPYRWITNIQVFEKSSQKMLTINQSPLHVLDAAGQILSLPIYALPHVILLNCIETLHLSFYNRPIHISLSALRNITLVNSINCLKNYSSFPTTIRSIRILLFHDYPNYMLPNWSIVSNSLSNLLELSSFRVFMYDLPEAIDDTSCQMIAKIAPLFSDFGFCFRRKFHSSNGDYINSSFIEHRKFVKQLCDYIFLLSLDKQMYYSIEDDGCGLIIWF